MIAEIDEQELERLLAVAAGAVEVPDDGPAAVLRAAHHRSSGGADVVHARRDRRFVQRALAAAAAILVLVGVAVAAVGHGSGTSSKAANDRFVQKAAPDASAAAAGAGTHISEFGKPSFRNEEKSVSGSSAGGATVVNGDAVPASPPTTVAPTTPSGSGTADSTKIVATGSSVLEVPKGSVPKTAAGVVSIARGVGGYVASQSSTGGASPAADVTVRVPYQAFDETVLTVAKFVGNVHGKVLSSTTNSQNVTAQYTDLQAKRDAAVGERNALDIVLTHATNVADILSVNDRIESVQSEIDQLTGQIRLLNDQASYSSLDVSISEKAPVAPTPHAAPKPRAGFSLAWHQAGAGFAHSAEWILARSGKGFVAIVAFIALLFFLRYLYPVVRRGLL
ncbi:MAG TPA: DUF4349 domain-containing protein [Acidimicrobiia bacterium]|jgi:hypothetical protein